MPTNIINPSSMKLERFELKYLIPHSRVHDISDYVESFCHIDRYADETGYYIINSLYLDSPDFHFYRRKMDGLDDRFNMRIRKYGSLEEALYFFEIKHKKNGYVRKYRYQMATEHWTKFYAGQFSMPIGSEIGIDSQNFQLFERLGISYGIEPKILTQYKRKAYFSVIDEYARVTFDSNLKFQKVDTFHFDIQKNALTNYDNPLIFPDGCDVILELKCTTKVPLWMVDLIKHFDLQRSSFSKYSSSLREMLWNNTYTSWDRVAATIKDLSAF